ncbi:MAG: 4Fe-4S dicluster domain-containing protein [Candidatus Bathyarchaeia archaeon]|nr:carboxypeptidase regulatory-like domain-containing protein [Candidatus Bathyarchaeota archaeon]
MRKWVMVINVDRCIACYACFIACKDEFWGNDYPPYSAGIKKREQTLIRLEKRERGKFPHVKVAYMPVLCMQCDNPPCMKAAKHNAVYKREDGIVIIDPVKAFGQQELLKACPYNAVSWNDEKNLPQKCTFCIHRVEEGKLPRCVQACPSGALLFGDLNDPESEVGKILKSNQAEPFHSEYGTKPNVYYINLYKMTKYFIAGDVAFKESDECAEGVEVTLINEATGESRKVKTDAFGSFEFDGLEPNTRYRIRLDHPGYTPKEIPLKLDEADIYLGYIFLEKVNR